MLSQDQINSFEKTFLAPYAMKSSQSRGRVHSQKEHKYRTVYQRDRDRIIHSTAFRFLEYKTQVFVYHEGDYYRTRLTHTLEVAQIARTMAMALRLNGDLAEAIALAHDLGHTPFGHSGEEALNELMGAFGGFNHNAQGLRVVDLLEERYPDFPGLNLSWEVREGIVKHTTKFDSCEVPAELEPGEMPTLETQIVDIADEIAYDNHDIDDGITSGLLGFADLERQPVWGKICGKIPRKYATIEPELKKYLVIRSLIDMQVTDLISETRRKIAALKLRSWKDVKRHDGRIVSFGRAMQAYRKPLRAMLHEKLYQHYRVIRMADKAKRFIKELFAVYVDRPEALPGRVQARIRSEGLERVVCDYLAGMTDRNALDEYKKLFYPYEKV